MSRRALLALAALCALATRGQAQSAPTRFRLHPGTDTAIGLFAGAATVIPVLVRTTGYNIQRARVTYRYDPAKVEIEAVSVSPCTGLCSQIDTSRGPGRFSVGAGGNAATFGEIRLYSLRVRLGAGVTDGTYIWPEIDSVTLQGGGSTNYSYLFAGEPGQVCHASERYGDVDNDTDIDSRDALIALTAAVGLSVTGFNLALADVDDDAAATSRDALMILSQSIGLSIFAANRLGAGRADACAPLTPLTDRIAFVRRGASRDSLFTLAAFSTTPVYVPGTAANTDEVQNPRVAGNGKIIYTCFQVFTPHICRVNPDGTGFGDLTSAQSSAMQGADYSPGDTLIALGRGQVLHTMDSSGGNLVQIGSFFFGAGPPHSIAWNRTSTRIAYASSGIRLINPDGTGDGSLPSNLPSSAGVVRWNAAGDSLAAILTGQAPGIYLLAVTGGTATRVASLPAYFGFWESFDWGGEGLLFALTEPGLRGIWLLPSNGGPLRRITRGQDAMPAFRRNP